MTKKVQNSKLQIIGFESRWSKSLGEEITKFLNENNDLELIGIKYSSFGFLLNSNREESYTALIIVRRIKDRILVMSVVLSIYAILYFGNMWNSWNKYSKCYCYKGHKIKVKANCHTYGGCEPDSGSCC